MDVRDRAQLALDDRVDVAVEEARAARRCGSSRRDSRRSRRSLRTRPARSRRWRSAASVRRTVAARTIRRCHAAPLDERRQAQVLRSPGERVGDPRRGQDFRRAGEQELPRSRIVIDAHLNRQEQVGHALDLIDHNRRDEPRDEAARIGRRGVPDRLIVESQDRRRPIPGYGTWRVTNGGGPAVVA